MRVSKNFAYFAVGSILTIAVVVSFLFMDTLIKYDLLFLAIFVLVPLIIIGAYGMIKDRSSGVKEDVKNRDAASMLSLIPGLGHFYLDKNFKGVLFFIGLVLSGMIFALGMISGSDNYGYVFGTPDVLYIYGILMLLTVLIWAALDVEWLCNEMGLEDSECWTIKRTDLVLSILLLTFFMLFISIAIIYYIDRIDVKINIAVALLSILLPLYVFLNYKYKKRNGTWQ